jgi:hypothetical protein
MGPMCLSRVDVEDRVVEETSPEWDDDPMALDPWVAGLGGWRGRCLWRKSGIRNKVPSKESWDLDLHR